eukprot:s2445_g14.t1
MKFKSCSRCVGIDCSGRDPAKLLVVVVDSCEDSEEESDEADFSSEDEEDMGFTGSRYAAVDQIMRDAAGLVRVFWIMCSSLLAQDSLHQSIQE